MANTIGNQTILPDVLKSLNAVPTWGESEEHWGKKPPLWVNDETQLNDENMNALSDGILKLQTNVRGLGDQSKQALKDIIYNSAGWKSSTSKNAEIFNDYLNNTAVSDYSHSEGQGTVAGMRGYYVGVVDQKSNFMLLSVEKTFTEISEVGTDSTINIDGPTCGYSVGEIDDDNKFYCFISGDDYDSQILTGKITLVNGNRIEFEPDNAVTGAELADRIVAKVFMHKFPSPANHTVEIGIASHSEGVSSHALGDGSHSEGVLSHSFGTGSHSEGYGTVASGRYSHSEGYGAIALGHNSHSEGLHTIANGRNQHVQGRYNQVDSENKFAHILGGGYSPQSRKNIHTVDWQGNAWYLGEVKSDADMVVSTPSGEVSLVDTYNYTSSLSDELDNEVISRIDADSELANLIEVLKNRISNLASKYIINGESPDEEAIDSLKDVLDWISGIKKGTQFVDTLTVISNKLDSDDAVGRHFMSNGEKLGEAFNHISNRASGQYSHAEGFNTSAPSYASHSEGVGTEAGGLWSHAEGRNTRTIGSGSHSEGDSTRAFGGNSHSEGLGTISRFNEQHVQGRYNEEDSTGIYAHIVGNGNSDDDRKNIHALDWDGNSYYEGDIYVGGASASTGVRIPRVYYGTSAPTNDIGRDGDIYIKYVDVDATEVTE